MTICAALLVFSAAGINDSPAQALPDTTVKGNLSVEVDFNNGANGDNSGDLTVEGETKLSVLMADMANVRSRLDLTTAAYYGPVQVGPRSYKIDYVFEKDVTTNGDIYLDLPLGRIGMASRAKIIATQTDGLSYEFAEWTLTGSRHRNIRCLSHKAYGAARHFTLKGSMYHDQMWVFLDFNHSIGSSANKTKKIIVSVEVEAQPFWGNPAIKVGDAVPTDLNSGNSIQPIEILESTIYRKYEDSNVPSQQGLAYPGGKTKAWNGDRMELNGEVILKHPQGDISMGVFASP